MQTSLLSIQVTCRVCSHLEEMAHPRVAMHPVHRVWHAADERSAFLRVHWL